MIPIKWKKAGIVLLSSLALLACTQIAAVKTVEWEHGWKTPRVTATRYKNQMVRYSIGFTYPKNPNDCDRSELSDFMSSHNGMVYQSGGYPGAEMFVFFTDVKDRPSANIKLQKILPALDHLIQEITK